MSRKFGIRRSVLGYNPNHFELQFVAIFRSPIMKQESILRSSTLFSLATLASRISGLIRDSCIAATIPAAWQDIFWAGIKIPSTFRELFAEGALSAAFIPLLTRVREREGESKAREVGHAIFNLLLLVVTGVVLVAILLAPWYVPLILNFPYDPATAWKVPAGIETTQMMFPFLIFIALSAWAMGILNTYRHFFMPAAASIFFNLSLIVGGLIGPRYFTGMRLMAFMAAAVVIGGFLQFAVQLPQARKIQFFPPPNRSIFNPWVKEFLLLLAPSTFGLAIYQINALITQTYFASSFGLGGISIMQYAFRLMQFPLGVVGMAISTASFPRIAQLFEQNKREEVAGTIAYVIKHLMLLMIPASIGLVVMGEDIVGLIYDRKEFHRAGWLHPTYIVLVGYSLGLFFYSFARVMVRSFQAHHDFKTPVRNGVVSMFINISLCTLFVNYFHFGLWSLAVASTLASTYQGVVLMGILKRRIKELRLTPLLTFLIPILLASVGMGLACYDFLAVFPLPPGTFIHYLIRVVFGMLVGLLAYGAFGWLLFRAELKAVLRLE